MIVFLVGGGILITLLTPILTSNSFRRVRRRFAK
jgi:hypothetical protein